MPRQPRNQADARPTSRSPWEPSPGGVPDSGNQPPTSLRWSDIEWGTGRKRGISRSDRTWALRLIGLFVAATVLVGFRTHAFDLPLETDECNYAYIGARLNAGDLLYADVWDHQPFGVFVLFAGLIRLFGDSPEVFRWSATAFSLVSLLLIESIVRIGAGNIAGIVAAILFALVSSDPGTAGEGCNRELFMNTLVLATVRLLLVARPLGTSRIFLAGLLLGVGSCFKTVLVAHWAVLAIWLSLDDRRPSDATTLSASARSNRKPVGTQEHRPPQGRVANLSGRWGRLAAFAIGPALLWGGAFTYFAATDRWTPFVDALFRFNLTYAAGGDPFAHRFLTFFAPPRHPFVFSSAWPVWVAGAIGMIALVVSLVRRLDRFSLAVVLLGVAGYVAVCLPARTWPHYYYLLIPTLVIAWCTGIPSLLYPASYAGAARWILPFLMAPVVGAAITEYRHYLGRPAFGVTITRYNSRDFWGRAIGEKIAGVTEPSDSVFVYGNEAEMYYYSGRRCASRFTMVTAVRPRDPSAAHRRNQLIADLERNRPRVVIVLFDQEPFPEWSAFLERYYGPAVGWDCHDRYTADCDQPRPEQVIMLVFTDRERPVSKINWNWDRSQVGGWFLGSPAESPEVSAVQRAGS